MAHTSECIALFVIGLLGMSVVQAQTAEQLHQQSCMRCHGTEVYTRDNRMMTSYAMLQAQVARCEVPAGAGWNQTQIQSVVDYLNTHFYKFPSP